MQPSLWQPRVELSEQEEQIVRRIRKAKLFVFLRQHRHELCDKAFQQDLASLYREAARGQPPVAPAMLALALILEAYTQGFTPLLFRTHLEVECLCLACETKDGVHLVGRAVFELS